MTSKTQRHLGLVAASATIAIGLGAAVAPTAASAQMVAGIGNSQSATEKVTIKSIDPATRHITVASAAGEAFSLRVPKAVQNFGQMKVGDTIKATYTRETEYVVSAANSPLPPDTETTVAARAAKGELPAAAVANHVVVTGAILGVDMTNHTVKIVSPQGGQVHTIFVRRPDRQAMMGKLKVGDTITAYVTEGLLIAVSPA